MRALVLMEETSSHTEGQLTELTESAGRTPTFGQSRPRQVTGHGLYRAPGPLLAAGRHPGCSAIPQSPRQQQGLRDPLKDLFYFSRNRTVEKEKKSRFAAPCRAVHVNDSSRPRAPRGHHAATTLPSLVGGAGPWDELLAQSSLHPHAPPCPVPSAAKSRGARAHCASESHRTLSENTDL